jgi:hypothetical protein
VTLNFCTPWPAANVSGSNNRTEANIGRRHSIDLTRKDKRIAAETEAESALDVFIMVKLVLASAEIRFIAWLGCFVAGFYTLW